MFPSNYKPDLILLPFKASVHDTSQSLALSQAQAMLASSQAEFVRIERSHPGASESLGWTFFERTKLAYVHTGDPLFAAEREARRHLRMTYAVRYEMYADDSLTPFHLNF